MLQLPKDWQHGLSPVQSPLLRGSWLVSFPPLSYMLKFSGSSYLIGGPIGVGLASHLFPCCRSSLKREGATPGEVSVCDPLLHPLAAELVPVLSCEQRYHTRSAVMMYIALAG